MKLKDEHVMWIIGGLIIFIVDLLFLRESKFFVPIVALSVTVAWAKYWYDVIVEDIRHKKLETEFPDFVRNMVSATKSGMPISQAIVYVADRDYGVLTPYVRRLANQITWNIPMKKALLNFSEATNNDVIKRAIFTVIEAESAGGMIEDVLEEITKSLVKIEEIKERRRAALNSHKVQNYIIFIVFVGVMVLIQNLIIPYITGSDLDVVSGSGTKTQSLKIDNSMARSGLSAEVSISFRNPGEFFRTLGMWSRSIKGILMSLAVIQGFFTGIVIGLTAEGDFKSGIKHSLIMVTFAVFVLSFASSF